MNDTDSPEPATTQSRAPEPEVSIDPRIDALVGEKLRGYFDSLVETGVPDRIVELIVALGEKEARLPDEKSS